MKKVSVVMCTYNGESYLREQLDSLVNQTYPIHELIIQDDGSTDNTLHIAEEYRAQYPDAHIKIYPNPKQLGFNRNFFSAYGKATGELITSCDQDDIWELHKIETLVREIEGCAFIFHNSVLFNSQRELGKLHRKKLVQYPHPASAVLMPQSFGHQIMFIKEALPLLEAFSDYNLSYDYFIYTLCSSIGKIKYIDEPLVRWRRHDDAATYSGKHGSDNKLYGYYRAIRSLFLHSNRETTKDYFKLCTQIDFGNKDINTIVRYMSKGTLWHLFKVCYLCQKYKQELVTDKTGMIQGVRAFFIPLFFIRDYGCYILRK